MNNITTNIFIFGDSLATESQEHHMRKERDHTPG